MLQRLADGLSYRQRQAAVQKNPFSTYQIHLVHYERVVGRQRRHYTSDINTNEWLQSQKIEILMLYRPAL